MLSRSGIRSFFLVLLTAVLLVIGQVSGAKAQDNNPWGTADSQPVQADEADPIDEVQAQIGAAGAYGFTANIEQLIIPRAIAANIGKTEERVDLEVTGQVHLPDYALLTLRFETGSGAPPMTLEQAGTKTYLLKDGERQPIENPLGAAMPTADFLGYLEAADNVRLKADASHPDYTIYEYEINGRRYADYVRAVMQRSLPADKQGIRLYPSPILQAITGRGELWIDSNGYPQRQIVDISIPQVNEAYDSQSHMVVDFHFDAPLSGVSLLTPENMAASLNHDDNGEAAGPATASDQMERAPETAAVPSLELNGIVLRVVALLLTAGFTLLVTRRPRQVQAALSVLLVLIFVTSPILQVEAAGQEQKAEEAATVSLSEALGLPEEGEAAESQQAVTNSQLRSNTGECGSGSDTADSDLDGTNDFVENCLGTDAYYFDTDRDQITDTLEIQGFSYSSQTWYSDPNNVDSNEDGLADYFEWPEPIGTAPAVDPDGDGVPNLWDSDNDGDSVPDDTDMNPFIVSNYNASFSLQTTKGNNNFNGYQYIEFQVQPQNAAHLRYTTTVLDWPYDEEGLIQDLDSSSEDITLTPILKVTTTNPPSSDLQAAYGLSAFSVGSGKYELYVLLSPVSDGGKITAFSGKVVYGPDELNNITWSKMELVWMAYMAQDEQNGDRINTETTPIVEYTEAAFRIAGLEVSKSGATDFAILGTPNSPADDRDVYQLLFGLEASFLSAVNPDLDEVVTRFNTESTPITQTWGIPAADVVAATPVTPPAHYDEIASSASATIASFLEDNNYPTSPAGSHMASLVLALETKMGSASLDDLDNTAGSSFTFSLANISTNTVRSLLLTQQQHDGTSWKMMESEDVLELLYGRYGELTTILANLQLTYPELTIADLYAVLFGYMYSWSTTGQSRMIDSDGMALVEETGSDADIIGQFEVVGAADLPTYLIEASDLAIEGAGLAIRDRTTYFNYLRSKTLLQTIFTVAGTLYSAGASAYALQVALSFDNANAFAASVTYWKTWLHSTGLKWAGVSSVDDLAVAADDVAALSLKAKVGSFMAKYSTRITYAVKALGLALSFAALGYELYSIWSTHANYSSPYDYDEEYATAYAITSTVIAVIFFLLAFNAIGLIFLAALMIATLIVWAISKAVGEEFDFMSEIIGGIASLFASSNPYTQVLTFEFDGLEVDSDGMPVVGSTFGLADEFTGVIWRVSGSDNSQLEQSEMYAWFDADSDENNITITTRRGSSRCKTGRYIDYTARVYYDNTRTCVNDLEADFTFGSAGRNITLELLYKVQANTRYESCGFAGISCSKKTDHMTLPDELDDGWDAIEVVVDVLPNTVDGLVGWAGIFNNDADNDDLGLWSEISLGTGSNNWDTDGDGLSDGFESGVQAEAGTNPLDNDSDNDGLNDGLEYEIGTTINDGDSDDDGLSDGDEFFHWNGSQWTGGGWFVTIDGGTYWVFSAPENADADNDGLNDASEKSYGSSPNAANEGPALSLTAGPYLLNGREFSVVVANGETVTASVDLVNAGPSAVSGIVSLCVPAVLTSVNVTASGDRVPATQQSGNCYNWNFGSNNLLFLQGFHVEITGTATGSTAAGEITVAVPYLIDGTLETISETIPFVQDNTPPAVQLTDPITGTRLNSAYYVMGGFAQDGDSWVDYVEVTVPGGTYTATGTSPWAYTWQLPADGIVNLSAVAYDAAGNASVLDSVQVTVDTQPPMITSNLPNGATISAGEALSTTFELSGTVTDNFSGLVRLQLRYNEQPWRTIWSTESKPLNTTWSGEWELPAVQSAQGEHNVFLRAYDDFGNVGYFTQTVFIDIIPPTTELTNRTYTSDNPPHVPANEALTLYGVVNDAGNNPLPADPADLVGTLHSIGDATVWLQPDTLADNDEGVTVAWIGDFNGDRLGDLAVGLPAAASGAGEVVVVRGSAGDWPIPNVGELEFLAENRPSFVGLPGAGLGTAIQPAGDFNGDGFSDMLVGDPVNNRLFLVFGTPQDFGTDRELDGSNGSRWAEITSLTAGETIGTNFAAAGDVNNDGLDDILVSTTNGGSGKVYLLLGDASYLDSQLLDVTSGAVLATGAGGASVATVGDVDGDFVDDFAVGMGGTVYLFAGDGGWAQAGLTTLTTGMAMATFASSDSQPAMVAASDLDGDNVDDFAFTNGSSPVVVFGDSNQSFSSQTLGGFPHASSGFLVSAGDVDNDGQSDLLVGNSNGDAYLLLGGALNSVAATIEGVDTAASAPYAAGADLAGDGSSDLLVVPSAAAAADFGYDTIGQARPPYVSGDWLPAGGGQSGANPGRALLGGGDVTVGKSGADFTTIQAAINSGADRVLIQPGVYKEMLTISGDVIIAGSGADLTWIQFPDGVVPSVLVDVNGASNVSLMNVSLVGKDSGTGLQVRNGANNVTLARTVIRDMATAVLVDGAATDLEVKNNTIVGNAAGFNATNCASVDVRSTVFAFNTGTALQYQGCAAVQLHQYNLYFANGTDLLPLDPGGGELFSDPLFLDYGSNDFRVEDASPVIDAGAPGDPVPPGAGDAADIGHIEQTGSSYFADDDYCSTCENDGLIWNVDAFATIQEAVEAAEADLYVLSSETAVQFTVGVGSGVYTESVVISDSIQLLGSDPDQTTIQGNGGPAVTFQATANAGIAGFTLIGGGADPIGVLVSDGSNSVTVNDNLIKNNDVGILVIERSSGSGQFNTIVANTVGVETSSASAADTQYNWFDLESNIISGNSSGLVANGLAVIFSQYNLLYNTVDYSNVMSGQNDTVGQDPLLNGPSSYLQADSPALDGASPLAAVPTGGGVRADMGWHELLAAPISILMGQSDDSIATESIGVAEVQYAIVAVNSITSPITSTLPATWTVADLDNVGETVSYWEATYTPTVDGFYRIYSRAKDDLGNWETDSSDWYDGAFVVDSIAPVVTLTLTDHWEPYMQLVEAEVYDYAAGTFDIEEIYFEINGQRVEGVWSLQQWEEDGVSPRTFHYFFRNLNAAGGTFSFQAFAVDGAGNVGSSTLQNKSLAGNVLGDDDFDAPRFYFVNVSDNVADNPPYDDLVGGTVTFQGEAGDFFGSGGLVPSWIDGYEISLDGGASWQVMEVWDRDTGVGIVPNGNFRYQWEVPDGLDATTIPVRIRATDNVGLSRVQVVTITVDTAAPRGFEPISFSSPAGYHLDYTIDMTTTWRQPLDGSGTAQAVVMYGNTNGNGVPWFEVNGTSHVTDISEGGDWYAHVGAEDDAGNVAYEVFGPWYPGSNDTHEGLWKFGIQSMVETIDGQLDLAHSEWLTETELLDTDNRPETPQSLWAAWDGLKAFLGWQGGWWENEGTLWAYYDVAAGGTDEPVTGTLSLPFDADFAVSIEDANTAYLWSYNGATWTAQSFATLTWPKGGSFGHDEVLGETEFEVMFYNCCVGTDEFASNRLMAFTLDDSGSVWSAFPTANSLDGSFDYYYEWPITTDGWDLLNQPVSAQQPFASLAFTSLPTAADTVSTDESIEYVLTVTNLEDEAADGLSLRLTASDGLSYQTVEGASCNDCAANDNWLLDIPTVAGNGTQVITVTAQLAADLTGISQVTTTGQLTTMLPVGSAVAIAHTIDTDAPTTTIHTNPGNALGIGLQTVTGSADDGLGAGVEMVEVSPDGSNWQVADGTQSWTADLTIPAGTTYQLYARATDYHGQTGPVVMVTFNLDTVAPILTTTVPALVGGSPVALLSGTTQDPAPAEARVESIAMQLDNSGNIWQSGAVYVADTNGVQGWLVGWTLPSEDGVAHTVRFRATDYAGNATLSGWFNTVVDTIAPAINVTQYNPVTSQGSVALAGSVTDGTAVSEVKVLIYPETGPATEEVLTLDGSQWSYSPALAIGEYKLLVQAEDTAGNQRIVGFYAVEVVEATATDIVMSGFTANGQAVVTVTYQINGATVPSFTIAFVKSSSSEYVVGTPALSSVVVSNAADLTAGVHSKSYVLGVDMGLVTAALETDEDYYLLAVADVNNSVSEEDVDAVNEDNTAVFQGVYHQSAEPVFVHGSDSGDTIALTHSGGPVVTFNGTPYSYISADVTAFRLRGHGNDDTINGSLLGVAKATYQMGGPGNDQLTGGLGVDVLVGGAGTDTLTGSGGGDKASYFDSPARAVVDLLAGSASEDGWGGTDTLVSLHNLEGTDSHDLLSGNNSVNLIQGRSGGDLINGRDGNDILYGGSGNDTLTGAKNSDTLYGEDGNDKLDGGIGNDFLYGGNNNDTMVGGADNDTLYGEAGQDNARGNGGNDIVYGGGDGDSVHGDAGSDDIYGDGGNDIMTGGTGADELYGGAGTDTLHANAASCTNDSAADSLDGGSESDSATYVSGQDTLANVETTTACSPRSPVGRIGQAWRW
jgi:hypothetical protein